MPPEYPPHPSSETLLRERRWLLGFSRALVGPADAEDLAQEAWLVALEKPKAPGYSPRAWLAGIARRLAASERRRGIARGDREKLHHDGTEMSAPDTASLAEMAELEDLAVAELLAMPEPLRNALLLRYRGGLSSVEIARREGLPEATVRGRVKTGLETLRTRMDRRTGSRQAWAIGLVGSPAWNIAPAPLTTSLLFSASMKKGLLAVAGSLLAATGLWLASQVGSELEPRPVQEADLVQRRSNWPLESKLTAPTDQASLDDARTQKAAPDLAGSVRFALVDEQARPLRATGGLMIDGEDVLALELDAQGRLFTNRVASFPQPRTETVRLLAGSPGSWPCWFEAPLQPGTHELTWPAGIDLRGQCLEAGAPLSEPIQLTLARDTGWAGELNNEQSSLAGALLPRTLTTAKDGTFELTDLPREWRGWLELGVGWKFAGGASHSTVFAAKSSPLLSFSVVRTPRLIGRLLDKETGMPVAEAPVIFQALKGQGMSFFEALTDGSGQFDWPLPSGFRTVQALVGLGPEWEVQSTSLEDLPVAGALDLGSFQLVRAERLELQLVDPSGSPVAGARLNQLSGVPSPVVFSDEQGRVSLGSNNSEPFRLRAFAPGFEIRIDEVNPRQPSPHVFSLQHGLAIDLIVENTAGQPVSGKSVTFAFDFSNTELVRWEQFAPELLAGRRISLGTSNSNDVLAVFETDEEGRIVLGGLPREIRGSCFLHESQGIPASSALQIQGNREGRWFGTIIDSGPRGLLVRGRVRSQSGTPLQGAKIRFEPFAAQASTLSSARSDAEGAFKLKLPGELGAGQLLAHAHGFERAALVIDPQIEANRNVEIELQPGRTLIFEFSRPDGSPCPELSVLIQEEQPGARARTLHNNVVVSSSEPLALDGFGYGDLKLLVTEGKLRHWFEPRILGDRVVVEVPAPAWLEVRLDQLADSKGASLSYTLLQADSRHLIHQGSFDVEQQAAGKADLPCSEGRAELIVYAGDEQVLHRDDLDLRWGETLTLP